VPPCRERPQYPTAPPRVAFHSAEGAVQPKPRVNAPLAAAALGAGRLCRGFGEDVCKSDDVACLKRSHQPQ